MRVLLFVQHGDGRPKCVGRVREWFPALMQPRYEDERTPKQRVDDFVANGWSLPAGSAQFKCTARQKQHHLLADRWWLVECENADAGRALIGGGRPFYFKRCERFVTPRGRILASGGSNKHAFYRSEPEGA